MPHAVSLLRAARLARSSKPFLARGGFKQEGCAGGGRWPSHVTGALRPSVATRGGVGVRVGETIIEGLLNCCATRDEALEKAVELLLVVGMPSTAMHR